GVVHAGLDRSERYGEVLRDLRHRHAEVVMEDENRSLLRGQPLEPTLQLVAIVNGEVVIGPVACQLEVDHVQRWRTTFARFRVAGVDQEPMEPGLESIAIA